MIGIGDKEIRIKYLIKCYGTDLEKSTLNAEDWDLLIEVQGY